MRILLQILVAAGLAVDAIVHWTFAPDMAGPKPGQIDGDTLFYAQAIVAAISGVLVLAWPRRWTFAVAFLVAASAVGALLLYYFVDVGRLGPIPAMHDPAWYLEKTLSLVGEGVATVAALAGFFLLNRAGRDASAGAGQHRAAGGR
ncbi:MULTISPECIES: hypothetical protein [Thermomonospora]|uniref:Uncharacterized protein n=1 Tax=Thermomonospora curvata (strain ATCC 19995 / DSM 43183 / JCM 3096 / KCTC 9072 / NBRC 15933 / NCIMB 10081 / Henssen B9) TaxID=471852 RepID=D1A4B1_THECD|nr:MULTISPECIES: hypothetical protein [Thermomonospora]ACY99985.1 hypothetical protein Tcur_4458 [Thermomonospora curvata DSM 43183]PKK12205.1 MAG: hypothetical protein BUE48_021935 [Thermomonospora sp. CIF 1]